MSKKKHQRGGSGHSHVRAMCDVCTKFAILTYTSQEIDANKSAKYNKYIVLFTDLTNQYLSLCIICINRMQRNQTGSQCYLELSENFTTVPAASSPLIVS